MEGSGSKVEEQQPSNNQITNFQMMKEAEHKKYSALRKTTASLEGAMSIIMKYDKKGKRRVEEEEEQTPQKEKKWKKLKVEKKELRLKRREGSHGSELYELGVAAKKIWEEVRQNKCKKERRQELCMQLMTLIKGKVYSLIFAHDTVRVIESLMAVGDEHVRTAVFEELKGDVVKLSKSKYARFFVLKMLKYGSRAQKDHVINSFKGHVVRLMTHKTASDVVELAYNDYANAKQRSMMLQEFFGPKFRLFHEDDIRCLDDALTKHPQDTDDILKDLRTNLQAIIDKGIFTNTMVHTLLRDFLTHCSVDDRAGVIDALKESLVPIIHTRDGARVAMLSLWHSTAKQRKIILKSFRTHFVKLATDKHGHMVLLAAFDCVDDTQFMKKAVLAEIMDELAQLVASDYGLRVLRYLVAPRSPIFFQPSVVAVLAQGDSNAASKKDTDIRQRELQDAVAAPILRLLMDNIKYWAVNPNWTLFIGAALRTLWAPEGQSIFQALAEMCAQPYVPGTEGHVLELAHTTKLLTYIIKCDGDRHAAERPTFSAQLLKTVEDDVVAGWVASNRGCFLLVTMVETAILEVVLKVKRLVSPLKAKLAESKFKGAEVLLKKL
ncbi:hypothetical protein OTU49_013028 [Cherax quadricarinatus]|uniref:PUM-HD domain-containing protein n=2 Tax=Cherax quadricarinatus TaxID=27406 RepID=A0AAW0VUA2_CHEQU